MNAKCYFSYSWETEIEDEILSQMKQKIEMLSNYKVDVIYDKIQ